MAKKKVFQISGALTEGLEETVSSAHNHSGDLRIDIIPLKKIEVDPENPRELALSFADLPAGPMPNDPQYERKLKERLTLDSIASSISREGVINPVVVYKFGDKYRLVAGERRTLASIIAGKQDIQARVLDKKPSPLKLSLLQWVENVEREDLSLWERLKNLEKIVASHQQESGTAKVTPTYLSQLIGCSLPHAMNYCAILEADAGLKHHIQTNQIRNLEKAALIAKMTNPTLKEQAVAACIEGATLKNLKALVVSDKRVINPNGRTLTKGRGRQALQVNLGVTKNPKVIRRIMEAVTQHSKHQSLRDKLQNIEQNIEWNSYGMVTDAFKRFIKVLEETEQ